jgi:hypothetical protein
MAEINVNFKIVEVHEDIGVYLVDYLADGATKERFGSQAGPVMVNIDYSICNGMTDQQLKEHIALQGLQIVRKQYDTISAETSGLSGRLSSLIDQTISVGVNVP